MTVTEAEAAPLVPRAPDGRWLPGRSANPNGRPRVPEVLRNALGEAADVLVGIMRGEIEDERVSRGQAAIEIIARQVARPLPENTGNGNERLQSLVDWLAGGEPDAIDAEFTEEKA